MFKKNTELFLKIRSMMNLENFACGIVFLLPVYLVKIKDFPTNFLEILIIIFLTIFFLQKKRRQALKNFLQSNKKYWWGWMGIILGLGVALLNSEEIYVSIGIIKGWFVLPFLFSVCAFLTIDKEKKDKLFQCLFWSSLVVAVLSLIMFIFRETTYDGRLQGIFNSPNYLGMYLALGFLAGLKTVKVKFFKILLGIILTVIFLTGSVLTWIAFSLALILTISIDSKMRFKKFVPYVGIIILVFVLAILKTPKMKEFFVLSERSSLSSRVMIWQAAEKIGKDNWAKGIGAGNFQTKYLEYQKHFPPYQEWAVPHPHSLYLTFWLSSGLIGVASFLLLLFLWAKDFLRDKKKETLLGVVSLGMISYFLIHGLADTTYFKNDLAVIFWLAFLSTLQRSSR